MFDFNHLKFNKISYWAHLSFAFVICVRILITVGLLLAHAILPFLKMPKKFSILGTSDYLFDKDYETKLRMLGPDKRV